MEVSGLRVHGVGNEMIFASGSFEKHMSGTSLLHFTSHVVHFCWYTYVHEASSSWFLWALIPVEKPRGKKLVEQTT